MPRRVAAGMSTLSTPVPARPITLRLVASARSARRSSSSPSGSGSRRRRRSPRGAPGRSSRGRGRPRSSARSSSTPESAIFSLTRTFIAPTPSTFSTTQSMHGGERLDVGGLDRREHPDPQLVAAELAVGLDVDDAVGAQRRGDRRGVDRVVEVDRADDQRALRGIGDERGREVGAPRPSRRGGTRRPSVRSTHQSSPPLPSIHSIWSASSSRVASAGRVVGLLLARVLERRLQREELRLPAAGGAVELLDPGDRGGAERGEPEAAVGAEALLRGEVVDVGLGGVERQARRRPRWRRSGPARRPRPPGARDRDHDAGRGLVVGPGDRVGAGLRRAASGASPGSASTTIGSPRKGAAAVALANFCENSP